MADVLRISRSRDDFLRLVEEALGERDQDAPRRRQACLERRHVARSGLERIARRYKPPQLVEIELPKGMEADPAMPGMGRVERSAKEPDARHSKCS
jgi:hypothetical protein